MSNHLVRVSERNINNSTFREFGYIWQVTHKLDKGGRYQPLAPDEKLIFDMRALYTIRSIATGRVIKGLYLGNGWFEGLTDGQEALPSSEAASEE